MCNVGEFYQQTLENHERAAERYSSDSKWQKSWEMDTFKTYVWMDLIIL